MASQDSKLLSIKMGVVKRTMNEMESYKNELAKNQAKVEELRSTADPATVRQWENVLAETESMIPDTENRLANGVEDLKRCLASLKQADEADIAAATQLVATAESVESASKS